MTSVLVSGAFVNVVVVVRIIVVTAFDPVALFAEGLSGSSCYHSC